MNVTSGEVREMLQYRIKRSAVASGIAVIGLFYRLLHVWLVQGPQLESMVHSTRDDPLASYIEIGAQDFIPVTLYATKDRDTHVRFDVPQS